MKVIALSLVLSNTALAYRTGVDVTFNCTSGNCHGQDPPQGTTVLGVSGLPAAPITGATYSLSVTVSNPNYQRHGFAFGITGGALSVTDGTYTQLFGGSPRDITHTTTRSDCGSPGCVSTFNFDWTAPSSEGVVTFRWRGNAVNGNSMPTGDTPSPAVESTTRTVMSPPDMTTLPDLRPPPDLKPPPDLCPPADLSPVVDLGSDPATTDLSAEPHDLAVASDLAATPVDMGAAVAEPPPAMEGGCQVGRSASSPEVWSLLAGLLIAGLLARRVG